jgi:hypothetical protein
VSEFLLGVGGSEGLIGRDIFGSSLVEADGFLSPAACLGEVEGDPVERCSML